MKQIETEHLSLEEIFNELKGNVEDNTINMKSIGMALLGEKQNNEQNIKWMKSKFAENGINIKAGR